MESSEPPPWSLALAIGSIGATGVGTTYGMLSPKGSFLIQL